MTHRNIVYVPATLHTMRRAYNVGFGIRILNHGTTKLSEITWHVERLGIKWDDDVLNYGYMPVCVCRCACSPSGLI